MTLFEEVEGNASHRLQEARREVRKEVTYRTGGTKGVEGWRKRVREEGAVGGSVAGSTAGWWPSDRDRFPPRFLLPPSLQTHNCIISTHLASSPPPSPSTSLVRSFSLFLFLSLPLSSLPPLFLSLLFCLSSPSANSSLTSFSIRPDARLRTCASLVSSRSSDRPTSRSTASLFPSSYIPSPLVFRTKELPHARNDPPPSSFLAASPRDADAMLFSRLHHSAATRAQQRPSPPLFLSFSLREAEVIPRIRFFILPPPFPLSPGCSAAVVSFSSFSLYLVVRSVIEPAIRVDTQLFIPHDVGSPRIGRTKPEDKRTNDGFERLRRIVRRDQRRS